MNTPKTIDPEANWLDGALWEFRTARYTIALFAEEECIDPTDSFEFEEDIEFAQEDDPAHWFCAVVAVYDETGERIGMDTLGGCSYRSFREFYSSHRDRDPANRNCSIQTPQGRKATICHYFPSMVAEAISEARQYVALQTEGCRAA